MTKERYLNIIYSIRDYLYSVRDIDIYIDEFAFETDKETFVEILTSLGYKESGYKVTDFAQINVYSKSSVDEVIADYLEALKDAYIIVKDFLNTGEVIDAVEITDIEIKELGMLESGHYVKTMTIYFRNIKEVF